MLKVEMIVVILCVQEGAMDLLNELKGFNMTLKLLQVGFSIDLTKFSSQFDQKQLRNT